MDVSAVANSPIWIWTLARAAALAVLATETLFLWTRRNRAAEPQGTASGRFFWAAVPAAVLAGLSLWCAASVAPRAAALPDAMALGSSVP